MNDSMIRFRDMITTWCLMLLIFASGCDDAENKKAPEPPVAVSPSEQNLLRAMELTDAAVASHFTGDGMAMARYYNPYTGVRSEEKGSVWMYTSAIEAVNAVLHALEAQNTNGDVTLYNEHFNRYSDLLQK